MSKLDFFNARDTFETGSGPAVLYRLSALEDEGVAKISRLPFSIRSPAGGGFAPGGRIRDHA